MANRHKMSCKASGGRVAYSGGGSNVAKEAAERKDGGRVAYAGGNSNVAKEAAERKDGGKVMGDKGKGRFDKRARGGGVNATSSPFSSAGKKGGGSDKHPFSSAKTGK